jgi:hypothetical protein
MLHVEGEMQKWTGLAGDACQYGDIGERIWVRETTKADYDTADTVVLAKYSADDSYVLYDHDDEHKKVIDHWWYSKDVCPSIHMPRDKSRINLEITSVRVERLNDISEKDAANEGLLKLPATGRYAINQGDQYFGMADHDPRIVFSWLWESINGAVSWQQNPWVWVIEFKRV